MKDEVVTPEDFLGDVIGDFNSRRGQIQSAWITAVTAHGRSAPASRWAGYVWLREHHALDDAGPRDASSWNSIIMEQVPKKAFLVMN